MILLKHTFFNLTLIKVAIVLCCLPLSFRAQDNPQAQNVFINQDAQQVIDEWNIKHPDVEFHSSFKPYLSASLNNFSDTSIGFLHFPIKNFFLTKTFNEGPSKRNQYQTQVLPIIDLQAGYDVLEKRFVSETFGGAHVKLNINNDFTCPVHPYLIDTKNINETTIICSSGRVMAPINDARTFKI